MAAIRIGELFIKKGLITRDQLRSALIAQSGGDREFGIEYGEKIGIVLVKKNYVKPDQLVRTLSEQKGNIDFLFVGNHPIEPRVVTWVSEETALKYSFLPLVSLDEESFLAITSRHISPDEAHVIEDEIKKKAEFMFIKDEDMADSIKRTYETLRRRGTIGIRIGELLVRDNYVTQGDMDEALKISAKTQRMVGKVLIETGKVNESDFFRMLSLQSKMQMVSAEDILLLLDRSIAKGISRAFCIHNYTVPYLREGADKVYVITAEPLVNIEELKKALNVREVDLKLATYSDITKILRTLFAGPEHEGAEEVAVAASSLIEMPSMEELSPHVVEDVTALARKYQHTTNMLILEAINKRASDIHIECYENDVVVRLRVDGTLYDERGVVVNKKNVSGIVNVIKISANMNIAERRLPQGGRFRRKTKDNRVYDFRVQSQPSLYGENMVLRVLDQSEKSLSIDKLGLLPDVKARYEQIVANPSGLVLITGPTGSGKTTTLYATLATIAKDLTKKIITIEDPIEYSIGRLQQTQIKEEIGFNYPQAIRSFLRQDPDVILVGEIRDRETALETMRASQTGHLVFSTVHVSNSIETIQRLLDFDLMSGTIASELLIVVSQRLAKRNCERCKVQYRPKKELLDAFYPRGVPPGIIFHRGEGCEDCHFMGHMGRIAVFEFWYVDMDSKKLILENASFEELFANAITKGLVPMIKDALIKVENGIVALEELPNIIPYFQIARWRGIEPTFIHFTH
ncbi:MAG: Flp pilus assembly complex ATPase component TadA [Deltaproteobacteria bacterium]|nr:Flp pilus assembly complex ATPase component TadA [Deltaproteobacteria bacterium]